MIDKDVTLETADGPVVGKLMSVSATDAVLIGADGQVTSVPRSSVTALKMGKPAKAPEDATAKPADDAKPAEKPKKEDKKDFPKLGLFTSHGLAYAHWKTSNIRDGGASYALDVGVGYNFRERLGLYALVGGYVGAPIEDKTIRGHFGRVALALRYKRKYFSALGGLGVGFSALVASDDRLRDVGIAVPIKLMGQIPLKNHFFIGIGIGYDFGVVQGGRVFNGIGAQLTVGRW